MQKFSVTGMSCAACSAHVEKAVKAVPGVQSVAVSLLTNSMGVEYTVPATADSICAAVQAAGYGAAPEAAASTAAAAPAAALDAMEDHETPKLRRRLIASLVLLLPLMYVSMGVCMWGWPAPAVLAENPLVIGIYQLVMSALVMVINQKFFISGFQGLLRKAPWEESLQHRQDRRWLQRVKLHLLRKEFSYQNTSELCNLICLYYYTTNPPIFQVYFREK